MSPLKMPVAKMSLCCWALAFGPLAASQAVGDAPWSAEAVVQAVKARELAIQSIEAFVERQDTTLPGMNDYSEATREKSAAEARFYGEEPPQWPSPSREPLPPPRYFYYHFQQNPRALIRLEYPDGPKRDGHSDEGEIRRHCYNGKVWQRYEPHLSIGPRVIIDRSVNFPPVLQALGLGCPFDPMTGNKTPETTVRPAYFSDLLTSALASGQFDQPKLLKAGSNGSVLLELVIRSRYENQLKDTGSVAQLTVGLDLEHGFAPVRMHVTRVTPVGNGFAEHPFSTGYEVFWNNISEIVPGVWLSRQMNVVDFARVALPGGGKEYKLLMKDGKPVLSPGGLKSIDFDRADIRRYRVSESKCSVTDLKVNHLSDKPLCSEEYPNGTIIENRITKEVYQLEGVSPAIEARLRKTLTEGERPSAQQQGKFNPGGGGISSWVWLILGVNAVVLLTAAAFLMRYRNKKRGAGGNGVSVA